MKDRGIDHLVVCVRDLDAARSLYQALGFSTTPPARHPFGTGNTLVQLQGNFIELLSVIEPENIPAPQPGYFNFPAFNQAFVEDRQGLSMLVFESSDARRDQAEFVAAGLDTYAPFDFSRQARLPDGSEVTVGFSLAFVTDPRLPQAAFFVCQQHAPQHFWKPEYQRHANTAQVVHEVIMVAPEPAVVSDLLAGLQGPEEVQKTSDGLVVTTARGRISVLSPAGFAARFPDMEIAGAPASPYFAGFGVVVTDVDAAERILQANGVPFRRQGTRLQIDPATALGVVIEMVGT